MRGAQTGIMGIRSLFLRVRWGEKSMVALYLSLLSGLVVALQYDAAHPFYSASSLDILVPFGLYFRSLHFYSSQLFFLLVLLHFLAVLLERRRIAMSFGKWLPLVVSLPVIVLLLFTGYVLRGDATGESAGIIAENIALSLPVAGRWLNELLFAVSTEGMIRVYANHLIGLCLLWLVLSWDHIRRYRVGWVAHGDLVLAVLVFCLVVNAPMEPFVVGAMHIAGPWFFLGLQELLRFVQPFWAGILFPVLPVAALCLLPLGETYRRRGQLFALVWVLLYLILTVIAWSRE